MRKGFGLGLALAFAATTWSMRAQAWLNHEHQEIAFKAFVAACERAAAESASESAGERDARLTLACGGPLSRAAGADRDRLWNRATVYGQAAALSGDHLGTADEFFSALGGRRVLSTRRYLTLALVNSAHFHPESVRHWRQHHVDAVAEAIAASSQPAGAARAEAFEHAYYLHAFADHFLEDSFAAGHMAFNRPASSASASLVFHNQANDRGRVLLNDRGNVWVGFGDGRLDEPENRRNRALVIEANTLSVLAFLRAFIDGKPDAASEDEATAIIPSACYAVRSPGYVVPVLRRYLDPESVALAEVRAQIEAAADDEARRAVGRERWRGPEWEGVVSNDDALKQSTRSLEDRAFKDVGLEARFLTGSSSFQDLDELSALIGSVNLRLFANSIRFSASAGGLIEPKAVFLVGPGLEWEVLSSLRGLVTHNLVAASWFPLRCATCFDDVILLGGYRLSVEAGPYSLSGFVLSTPVMFNDDWSAGWTFGVGVEALLSAAGGGPL